MLGLKQGGNFYYMLSDGLGSVRSIVDSNGDVVETTETDAYGVNLSNTGSAELRANTFTGVLGVCDDCNGLYYARNRYYNPQLGRWLSRDPIGYSGGDLSLCRYVGGQPTNAVDPSGLNPALLALAEAAGWGAGSSILVGGAIRYYQGRPVIDWHSSPGLALTK